jgi:hypothetical protein
MSTKLYNFCKRLRRRRFGSLFLQCGIGLAEQRMLTVSIQHLLGTVLAYLYPEV